MRRGLNLDGLFGLLANVAWTTIGPVPVPDFEATRLAGCAARGPFAVYGIDKFPRMTDYVVPAGVRIAHADRVRLGAYLADGTTVMHEGFVNFNAGTLGVSMVEGRISAGVVVGDHSDIGGGASIMGTLSGGGKQDVSVGERCLLGANAGIGISLGNDCVVEAGLYVTAGTRVTLPDGEIIKAVDLSGLPTCCSGATRSPARSRSSPQRLLGRPQRRTARPQLTDRERRPCVWPPGTSTRSGQAAAAARLAIPGGAGHRLCSRKPRSPTRLPLGGGGRARLPVGANGNGRWNGVAILSRVGVADVVRGFEGEPGIPETEARAVAATCGGVRTWSIYVPNGRALDSPQCAYKLAWLAALRGAPPWPSGAGAGGGPARGLRRLQHRAHR